MPARAHAVFREEPVAAKGKVQHLSMSRRGKQFSHDIAFDQTSVLAAVKGDTANLSLRTSQECLTLERAPECMLWQYMSEISESG